MSVPVVLWPLCSCAVGSVQLVRCSGINNKRKAVASLWLLCGSEEALRGWKRLMKSTRESVGVPATQRCNPSRSPLHLFFRGPPFLSRDARPSLNDLRISLIFQGPSWKTWWVLFSLSLSAFSLSCCPRMDGKKQQQRSVPREPTDSLSLLCL